MFFVCSSRKSDFALARSLPASLQKEKVVCVVLVCILIYADFFLSSRYPRQFGSASKEITRSHWRHLSTGDRNDCNFSEERTQTTC